MKELAERIRELHDGHLPWFRVPLIWKADFTFVIDAFNRAKIPFVGCGDKSPVEVCCEYRHNNSTAVFQIYETHRGLAYTIMSGRPLGIGGVEISIDDFHKKLKYVLKYQDAEEMTLYCSDLEERDKVVVRLRNRGVPNLDIEKHQMPEMLTIRIRKGLGAVAFTSERTYDLSKVEPTRLHVREPWKHIHGVQIVAGILNQNKKHIPVPALPVIKPAQPELNISYNQELDAIQLPCSSTYIPVEKFEAARDALEADSHLSSYICFRGAEFPLNKIDAVLAHVKAIKHNNESK